MWGTQNTHSCLSSPFSDSFLFSPNFETYTLYSMLCETTCSMWSA